MESADLLFAVRLPDARLDDEDFHALVEVVRRDVGTIERRAVDEDVRVPVIALDEAEALIEPEPLHCPLDGHGLVALGSRRIEAKDLPCPRPLLAHLDLAGDARAFLRTITPANPVEGLEDLGMEEDLDGDALAVVRLDEAEAFIRPADDSAIDDAEIGPDGNRVPGHDLVSHVESTSVRNSLENQA